MTSHRSHINNGIVSSGVWSPNERICAQLPTNWHERTVFLFFFPPRWLVHKPMRDQIPAQVERELPQESKSEQIDEN